MLAYFISLLLLSCAFAAPNMEELEGTWTSKSNTVFTGPGLYDPVDELLIEPARCTESNPTHKTTLAPSPVSHSTGTYEILSNGSVVLTPIAVDGRQLLSDPCGYSAEKAKYVRYVQPTWFEKYQVSINSYHGRYMLQIYQFDGSPMQPLYLAYKPPMMLPTTALNPTDKASETSSSLSRKVKRSLENQYRTNAVKKFSSEKFDKFWWMSVGVLGVGSAAWFLR
ncbi:Reversal of tor2 lethality [Clavispora lusitaniae]|nr:Reversal of tor2 lethality [Clavispora lusitaniae]